MPAERPSGTGHDTAAIWPTVVCPYCEREVETYQHPAGVVLMCEHRKPNKQWLCEGGGRAPR